jgi:hypothetical protein
MPEPMTRPEAAHLLRSLEACDTPRIEKPTWACDNPFARLSPTLGRWVEVTNAEDRIGLVRGFGPVQCRRGMEVPNLQKTVRDAIGIRLRVLDRQKETACRTSR